MSWISTAVTQTETEWTVRAEDSGSGESVELAYPSEAQARYMAAVLAMGPKSLPKQAIIRKLQRNGVQAR